MDERLDRWALAHNVSYLKRVRLISAVVGFGILSIAVVAWFILVGMLSSGVQPTLGWFFIWQFIPVVAAYPCYLGWYFADLGLLRNYYGQY